jgi:CreA protein
MDYIGYCFIFRRKIMRKFLMSMVVGMAMCTGVQADNVRVIGKVDSGFNLIGPNNAIKAVVVTDPMIPQISCYISFAEVGGASGIIRNVTGSSIGAERNEMSVACRKMVDGAISIPESAKVQRDVFAQNRGGFLRSLNVVGMYDNKNNTMIYIVMANTVIDGSPKNSITAVPLGF